MYEGVINYPGKFPHMKELIPWINDVLPCIIVNPKVGSTLLSSSDLHQRDKFAALINIQCLIQTHPSFHFQNVSLLTGKVEFGSQKEADISQHHICNTQINTLLCSFSVSL